MIAQSENDRRKHDEHLGEDGRGLYGYLRVGRLEQEIVGERDDGVRRPRHQKHGDHHQHQFRDLDLPLELLPAC